MTHGGGGVTLHSKWKSQFDDSEASENETEMKASYKVSLFLMNVTFHLI